MATVSVLTQLGGLKKFSMHGGQAHSQETCLGIMPALEYSLDIVHNSTHPQDEPALESLLFLLSKVTLHLGQWRENFRHLLGARTGQCKELTDASVTVIFLLSQKGECDNLGIYHF